MSSHEEAPLTLKQKKEIDSTLKKQNFEEMQNLLQKVSVKGSTNMEHFNMAKDYLRDNLKATKEQKQEAFNFVIKNLPQEAKLELVAELKKEKEKTQEIKVAQQPKQQEEKKDYNLFLENKIRSGETLNTIEKGHYENHLDEQTKKDEMRIKKMQDSLVKTEQVLQGYVSNIKEKYERGEATQDEKQRLVLAVGLLDDVKKIKESGYLEKGVEEIKKINADLNTLSSHFQGLFQNETIKNSVQQSRLIVKTSISDTINSLNSLTSSLENISKEITTPNSKFDKTLFLYEKTFENLDRNTNFMVYSVEQLNEHLKNSQEASKHVQNSIAFTGLTLATFGTASLFQFTGLTVAKAYAAKYSADYAMNIAFTYAGKGEIGFEDLSAQILGSGVATITNVPNLSGAVSTGIKTVIKKTVQKSLDISAKTTINYSTGELSKEMAATSVN